MSDGSHTAVLQEQAVEGLKVRGDGCYVDATFGRGGHSRPILARLGPGGRLIALDCDPQAVAAGGEIVDGRFRMLHGRFSRLAELAGALEADALSLSRWEGGRDRLRTLINVGRLAPGEHEVILQTETATARHVVAVQAGVVASLPITLMVATSILQITLMLECGAIARVVALIKSVAPKDQVVQMMIVNIGFGTLLAALGATPVSILPPIMVALGYSSFIAIALPAIGYDALTTYACSESPSWYSPISWANPWTRLAVTLRVTCRSLVRALPWGCSGLSAVGKCFNGECCPRSYRASPRGSLPS